MREPFANRLARVVSEAVSCNLAAQFSGTWPSETLLLGDRPRCQRAHIRQPTPGAKTMSATPLDYDGLMQANLARVFGERDASRRLKAIAQLYTPDATLYEPDAEARGHAAINQAVEALLSHLPPNFAFSANGPAVGHHDIGRLRWQSGPPNGPVAVSGTDVAHFEAGRIQTLHVFLDPASA